MKMDNQQRIVVIGVNYETNDMALRFVHNLSAIAESANVIIILVDNSEGADSSDLFGRIYRENPEVICVKPPRNLGYFKGASFGLSEYLGTGKNFDWVIVSNVDIEFRDNSFFTHLKDAKHIENVGVVAPSIWSNVSRRDLNPRMVIRPMAVKMRFYKWIYKSFYLLNLYELLSAAKQAVRYVVKYKLLSPVVGWFTQLRSCSKSHITSSENDLQFIYAPQGSCIIFSKLFFLRGGSLDYPMFLFGEEIYVAETARSLGLCIVYNPQLKLWHDDHQSTGKIRSRKIASNVHESAVFIADTYFWE